MQPFTAERCHPGIVSESLPFTSLPYSFTQADGSMGRHADRVPVDVYTGAP